ncbi:MAG: metallophosphoesterase [Coriobacteriia bacterium]|nr:metallophosphoesterase [Coriobacteriia bacterium]
MARERPDQTFLIAQISDLHCGESLFDAALLRRAIHEINEARPNLVMVPGDLTANGYRREFEEAKEHLALIECENVVIIAGNHDCRNVGYLHFEEIFGRRYHELEFPFGVKADGGLQERIKIVAADSNKPDLNDGELGRDKYDWILKEFGDPEAFKVFALHHHVISIPGTGRERNILLDAGDVLEALNRAGVDLVLAGHKHVAWAWPVAGMLAVTSGTSATWRTRGKTPPSYNLVRIASKTIEVTVKDLSDHNDVELVYDRGTKCPLPTTGMAVRRT